MRSLIFNFAKVLKKCSWWPNLLYRTQQSERMERILFACNYFLWQLLLCSLGLMQQPIVPLIQDWASNCQTVTVSLSKNVSATSFEYYFDRLDLIKEFFLFPILGKTGTLDLQLLQRILYHTTILKPSHYSTEVQFSRSLYFLPIWKGKKLFFRKILSSRFMLFYGCSKKISYLIAV